jgi:hypothetical protein
MILWVRNLGETPLRGPSAPRGIACGHSLTVSTDSQLGLDNPKMLHSHVWQLNAPPCGFSLSKALFLLRLI